SIHTFPLRYRYPSWWRVLFIESPFREPVPLSDCCPILYAVPPNPPDLGYPSGSARTCQNEHGEWDRSNGCALAHEPTTPADSNARQAPCCRCIQISAA